MVDNRMDSLMNVNNVEVKIFNRTIKTKNGVTRVWIDGVEQKNLTPEEIVQFKDEMKREVREAFRLGQIQKVFDVVRS